MANPHWMDKLFQDRFDIWRPADISFDGDGVANIPTYTKVGSLRPGYYIPGDNISSPTENGPMVDTDMALTFDTMWFGPDEDVRMGDVIVIKTSGSPAYGMINNTRGNPKRVANIGTIKHERIEIHTTPTEYAPAGVTV